MKFWSFEYRNLQTPFHWTERDTCAVNSPSVNSASARSPFSKVCCVVAADYCCLSGVFLHIYSCLRNCILFHVFVIVVAADYCCISDVFLHIYSCLRNCILFHVFVIVTFIFSISLTLNIKSCTLNSLIIILDTWLCLWSTIVWGH